MPRPKGNVSEAKVISVNLRSKKIEDRRKFKRFPLELAGRYLLEANLREWKSCSVVNVCREGMGIEVSFREKVEIGSIMQIEIKVPEKKKPVITKGILKWIRELEKINNFLGGVELTKVNSEGKWTLLDYAYGRWAEKV